MSDGSELKDQLFSLLKQKERQELHLFITKRNSEGKCIVVSHANKSICKKLNFKDTETDIKSFHCQDGDSARRKSAEIGSRVCGTCVSHLFTSE